jgi:hypothetical protein
MKQGTFMDIVGVHYKDIRNLFISRDVRMGKVFSDDSFNSAFIKCVERFADRPIGYDEAVRYFWVAYENTEMTFQNKQSRFELRDEFDDIIDDDETCAERLYDIVMDSVSEQFGENDMMVYSLHKYHGWSKEDLISDGYDCSDFEERIRTIHRFVKTYGKKRIKKSPL